MADTLPPHLICDILAHLELEERCGASWAVYNLVDKPRAGLLPLAPTRPAF